MRDVYFALNECTEEELNELREKLLWDVLNDEIEEGVLAEEDYDIIASYEYTEDIPFELLEKVYGIYTFVDEDFWCNC